MEHMNVDGFDVCFDNYVLFAMMLIKKVHYVICDNFYVCCVYCGKEFMYLLIM